MNSSALIELTKAESTDRILSDIGTCNLKLKLKLKLSLGLDLAASEADGVSLLKVDNRQVHEEQSRRAQAAEFWRPWAVHLEDRKLWAFLSRRRAGGDDSFCDLAIPVSDSYT